MPLAARVFLDRETLREQLRRLRSSGLPLSRRQSALSFRNTTPACASVVHVRPIASTYGCPSIPVGATLYLKTLSGEEESPRGNTFSPTIAVLELIQPVVAALDAQNESALPESGSWKVKTRQVLVVQSNPAIISFASPPVASSVEAFCFTAPDKLGKSRKTALD